MNRPNLQLRPLAVLVPLILTTTAPLWAVGVASAVDTGDAPDSYGIASHAVVEGAPYLGRISPDDNEQAASLGADADDIANGDDEDGVFDFPDIVGKSKDYSIDVFASNPGSTDATLIGWVDANGNGAFDELEVARTTVPAGARNIKYTLRWPDLEATGNGYVGDTYARFRITTAKVAADDATGMLPDGEVEDYVLTIQPDVDGDGIPDAIDPDNDNDGIPDEVETVGVDTDGDGTPDTLDSDSDGDGLPDFVEAGAVPSAPVDTDEDGTPDYLDLDSNNDGTPDSDGADGDADGDGMPDEVEGAEDSDGDGVADRDDLDADNDSIPDAIERGGEIALALDSDRDGVPDMLDLDSDNDGIPDLWEANSGEIDIRPLDTDRDGRIDSGNDFGPNGLSDAVETEAESGVPVFTIADTDGDGMRDYLDLDSDADSVTDVAESGRPDSDGNGLVDELIDSDGDGQPDGIDVDGDGIIDGSNAVSDGELPDTDDDGIPAFQDPDDDGSSAAPGDDDAPSDDDARIETGLSGGAGCSISDRGGSPDPLFALFALGAAGMLARRRRNLIQGQAGEPIRVARAQDVEDSTTN